jgi:hypothetical protein
MNRQKGESPLDLIRNRPSRKGRAESLLRFLTNTSYPHAVLANLTVGISEQVGITDSEELSRVAGELRDAERGYELFDFIRCIELKRQDGSIKVVIKRLKLDPAMKEVRDTVRHHELMAQTSIELPDPGATLNNPKGLARDLMQLFSRVLTRGRLNENAFNQSTWMCRSRLLGATGTQLDSLVRKPSDVLITVDKAIDMLVQSFNSDAFHVILTQDTVLLLDQQKRLWGPEGVDLSKEP